MPPKSDAPSALPRPPRAALKAPCGGSSRDVAASSSHKTSHHHPISHSATKLVPHPAYRRVGGQPTQASRSPPVVIIGPPLSNGAEGNSRVADAIRSLEKQRRLVSDALREWRSVAVDILSSTVHSTATSSTVSAAVATAASTGTPMTTAATGGTWAAAVATPLRGELDDEHSLDVVWLALSTALCVPPKTLLQRQELHT